MHRVFRDGYGAVDEHEGPEGLRAFLRSLGLAEEPSGTSYLYYCADAQGRRHQLATVWGSPRRATVYLYPDALGRGAGPAAALYRALDEAEVDLGSKLGPSIGLDLENPRQLALFCDGMTELMNAR